MNAKYITGNKYFKIKRDNIEILYYVRGDINKEHAEKTFGFVKNKLKEIDGDVIVIANRSYGVLSRTEYVRADNFENKYDDIENRLFILYKCDKDLELLPEAIAPKICINLLPTVENDLIDRLNSYLNFKEAQGYSVINCDYYEQKHDLYKEVGYNVVLKLRTRYVDCL